MSLRVWLPLIGNLNNYGANNVTVTNSNASVDASGKIGSCYRFNKNAYINLTNVTILNTFTECSFSLWLKLNSFNASYDTYIQLGNGNTPWASYILGLLRNNANSNLSFCISDGSSSSQNSFTTPNLSTNTWYHIACVYRSGHCLIYINGALHADNTTTIVPKFSNITSVAIGGLASNYKTDSFINDFRIYDHALSAKEVKEISKALVVHFPLNGNGLGIPNMVDHSSDFSGWSAASGWIKSVTEEGTTYRFTRTGATANNWVRLIPTALRVDGNNYPNGITVSMDLLTPDKSAINQKCLGSLQTYDASGARTGWYEPGWDLTNVVNNEWSRVSFTFSKSALLTNSQGLTYSYTQFSFQLVQNGDITIRKIKIEEGTKATQYTVSRADVGGNIEVDTSGYKNNGTASNTGVSSEIIRYTSSTKFNGSNAFIACGRGGMVKDAITISLWAYQSSWSSFTRPISCTEGGGWNFENNSTKIQFPVGTGTSSNTYKTVTSTIDYTSLSAGWHMFTGTYDGLALKLYIDGVLNNTTTAFTTKTPIFYNSANGIFIGAEAGGNQTTPAGTYFNGNISDVRIYATALSADDIKELYNTPASISNIGAILSYEFNEI